MVNVFSKSKGPLIIQTRCKPEANPGIKDKSNLLHICNTTKYINTFCCCWSSLCHKKSIHTTPVSQSTRWMCIHMRLGQMQRFTDPSIILSHSFPLPDCLPPLSLLAGDGSISRFYSASLPLFTLHRGRELTREWRCAQSSASSSQEGGRGKDSSK